MKKIKQWMKDNTWAADFISVLIGAVALCAASVVAARLITHDDLAQIIYMVVIFFPITAAIIGILTRLHLKKLWAAPVIADVCIAATTLIIFRNIGIKYLIFYTVVSIVGYGAAHFFKGVSKRK